jgi:hypothetical protein
MNNIIYLIIIIVFLNFNIFSQSWFKSFNGKIGSANATLNIVRYNENIRAYYYYDKYCKPIEIFGSLKNDSLILSAFLDNYTNETFSGILKSNTYTGLWVSSQNENNNLSFSFTENSALSSEFVFVYGKEYLFKGEEIPFAEYTEGVFWASAKFPNSSLLRNTVLKIKNLPEGSAEIGKHLLKNKKIFMDNYKAEYKNLTKQEAAGIYSYNMEEQSLLMPVYFNEKVFSLALSNYWYTGGAHGNYGTSFYSLNLKNNKIIKLEDIITASGISSLPDILEKNYRSQYNVPANAVLTDYLFVDKIPVNENYLITKGNLMFNYVPYEISSYAAGEIRIFVPIEDISQYLKPGAAELFN